MKKQLFASLTALLIISLFVVGCSSEDNKTEGSLAQKMMDTVASSIADNLAKAVVEPTDQKVALEEIQKVIPEGVVSYGEMLYLNNNLYAVSEEGVKVYDTKKKSEHLIKSDDRLNSIAIHEDQIYVGGDALYILKDTSLEFVDDEFEGVITRLYSYGYQLMVGTEFGLYSRSVFGKLEVFEDIPVSAMAADGDGLWVGTYGEGLYRWDGETFKKRYLSRDPELFDTVLTLDFNHKHLYMGSVNGFHVYDGGSWTTLTETDGLPSNRVNAVDASDWTIQIGTDNGLVEYFNDSLTIDERFAQVKVNDIYNGNRKFFVSTEFDGVKQKAGNILKTIIEPVSDEEIQYLSLVF